MVLARAWDVALDSLGAVSRTTRLALLWSGRMVIVTKDDLKLHLGIPSKDTTKDDRLEAIAYGATASVAQLARDAGVVLVEEEVTERYDGEDSERIILTYRPVLSVTGVWVSDNRVFDDDAKVDATRYVVYDRIGILRRADGVEFSAGIQNVKVTYKAGLIQGQGTPPADLKTGITMLAAAIWGQAGKEGLASEKIGDYSYSLQEIKTEMPGAFSFLSPYINRLVVR